MTKVDDVMEAMRRDVRRWKAELVRLKTEGHSDVAARMENWIQRAEKILARLEATKPSSH